MPQKERVQQVMQIFGRRVVQGAKAEMLRQGMDASGKLYKSIDYDLTVFGTANFTLKFSFEDYGKFQDEGVSGTKKKYDTPNSYKAHPNPFKKGAGVVPPASAFGNWVIRKGLKGTRDAKGRFTSRKGLQFAIARSIYYYGIKPKRFFSNPFGIAFKNLPQDITKAFELTEEEFKIMTTE